jgi:hypothetical protein
MMKPGLRDGSRAVAWRTAAPKAELVEVQS